MTFAPAIPSPKPYGGAITLSYIIQNIHYQALRWTLTAPSPLHQCSKSIKTTNTNNYDVLQQESGRTPAEIVGSNPTGGMDICLL
jgi:hypothetical protein